MTNTPATPPPPPERLRRYAIAVLAVAAALLLRGLLAPWLASSPYITCWAAVAVAVWFGGIGPGLVAATLGYASSTWLFMPPGGGFATNAVTLAAYAFSAGLIIVFGHARQRALQRQGREVRDRRAAEAAEAAQRERLQATLACIGDAVIVTDAAGLVVSSNAAAQRLSGWPEAEAIGRDLAEVLDLVDEQSGLATPHPALHALDQDVPVGLTRHSMLRPRGGTPLPIEDSVAPIVDAGGQRVGAVLVFRDVAARREAEHELLQAHEALHIVVQSSPLAVVVVDAEPPVVRLWNGAAERLFGWRADEVIDRPLPIVPAEKRDEAEDHEQRLRLGASLSDVETIRQRADGSRVEVRMSAAPLRDAMLRTTGSLLLFADISERKQAQASLLQSDATLRAFFDNAPACLGVVEPTDDGDILHLQDNPVTCRVFGVEPGGTAGRRASALGAPAEIIALWLERYRASAARGSVVAFDYTQMLDGAARRFRASVCPIGAGPQGRMRYCYMSEDITERHAAQSRLVESEAGARLALQVARLGTWSWDACAGEVQADARTREICGLGSDDALRLSDIARRIHPDDALRIEGSLAAAVAPDGPGQYAEEFRFVHADGGVHWVVARGQALFDGQGASRHVTRVLGSLLETTERRRSEELLAQADRRKNEFLATLAHELRNPLAPLRNGVHLLRHLTEGLSTAERPLAIMERQLGHMVRLIDDLLDIGRVSGDKLRLQRQRVDLAPVLQEAIETSQPVLDAAGHTLTVTLPNAPLFVDVDPTRLCQVIANLLNNAAKYTPRPGRVRLGVEPRAGMVDITVEDDGRGIAPEVLPRIFDMFTQVESSLERSQGGLGIGLAIARRLVEMHGGHLHAHSGGAGQGSRFVVSLPLADDLSAAGLPPGLIGTDGAPRPVAGAGLRILVADDNTDSADSLSNILRMMGNQTRVANDGLQAFELAAEFRPEIALLDIGMPRLNGYELARRLRAQPWGLAMRLVAVTGWGQDADRLRSEQAGFDLHWVKPVDPAALDALLDSVARDEAS